MKKQKSLYLTSLVFFILDLLLWIFWFSYKVVCKGWNIINPLCWGVGFLTKLFLFFLAIAFFIIAIIKLMQASRK